MKQINVCVGVKVSNCNYFCNKLCNFFSTGKCHLFDKNLKYVKDDQSNDIYLRCLDCIDHEE